jgi:DNA-binding transcriptional ArsR family regulator
MKQPAITAPLPDLSADQREMLAELFHLLGERNRLGIVLSCLDRPMAVGDIASSLGLSQSLVSHHLRLLRAARLLRGERRGKQVFYTAADEHVRCVVTDLANHVLEPGHSSEE